MTSIVYAAVGTKGMPPVTPPEKWNANNDKIVVYDDSKTSIQSIIESSTFRYTLVQDSGYDRLLVQLLPAGQNESKTEVGELIFKRRINHDEASFEGDGGGSFGDKKVQLLVIDTKSGRFKDMIKQGNGATMPEFLAKAFDQAKTDEARGLIWVDESASQRNARQLESYQKELHGRWTLDLLRRLTSVS